MNRTSLVVGVAALLSLGLWSVWVVAEEKAAPVALADLEKMSGKDLYRNTCKRCHAAESPAGEYTPMTLIEDQWVSFFDKKYVKSHAALLDSTQALPAWVTPDMVGPYRLLTPKMLEKIRKFAIDGAADSEHPMTCG